MWHGFNHYLKVHGAFIGNSLEPEYRTHFEFTNATNVTNVTNVIKLQVLLNLVHSFNKYLKVHDVFNGKSLEPEYRTHFEKWLFSPTLNSANNCGFEWVSYLHIIGRANDQKVRKYRPRKWYYFRNEKQD